MGSRASFLAVLAGGALVAQVLQNPSPMVEHTRAHARVKQVEVPGRRVPLSLGTLLLPQPAGAAPLVIHFHGAAWLAEWSATRRFGRVAVLTVHLGAGSAVYAGAFAEPDRFSSLLEEAARLAGRRPQPVILTAFSAGCAAIREILRHRQNWPLVDAVVLVDGIHAGYIPEGHPGPLQSAPLDPVVDFAREAVAGRKQMIITHSEIFPGTFASTTETVDYALASLRLQRRAVLKWGPLGMQQTSEVRARRFLLLGFAGNSAPDHLDHLHALEHWLRKVKTR